MGAAAASDQTARLQPVADARRLRVTFNGSVSDVLPWRFTPQQREVRVLPGETALAFYTATNTSAADIIGVATYSVTPGQVAPYFSKIQCFCFEGVYPGLMPERGRCRQELNGTDYNRQSND